MGHMTFMSSSLGLEIDFDRCLDVFSSIMIELLSFSIVTEFVCLIFLFSTCSYLFDPLLTFLFNGEEVCTTG